MKVIMTEQNNDEVYIPKFKEIQDSLRAELILYNQADNDHPHLGLLADLGPNDLSIDPETGKAVEDIEINNLEAFYKNIIPISRLANGKYLTIPYDEEPFSIDLNTRKINIPNHFMQNGIGIKGDHKAELIMFVVDRFFDYMDLANTKIGIKWQLFDKSNRPTDQSGITPAFCPDPIVDSSKFDNHKLSFGWIITEDMTKEAGKIKFSIVFTDQSSIFSAEADFNNIISEQAQSRYILNTLPEYLVINDTLTLNNLIINSDSENLNSYAAFKNILKNSDTLKTFFADIEWVAAPPGYFNIFDDDTVVNPDQRIQNRLATAQAYCLTPGATINYEWKKINTNTDSTSLASNNNNDLSEESNNNYVGHYDNTNNLIYHDQDSFTNLTNGALIFIKTKDTKVKTGKNYYTYNNGIYTKIYPTPETSLTNCYECFTSYGFSADADTCGTYLVSATPTASNEFGRTATRQFKILPPFGFGDSTATGYDINQYVKQSIVPSSREAEKGTAIYLKSDKLNDGTSNTDTLIPLKLKIEPIKLDNMSDMLITPSTINVATDVIINDDTINPNTFVGKFICTAILHDQVNPQTNELFDETITVTSDEGATEVILEIPNKSTMPENTQLTTSIQHQKNGRYSQTVALNSYTLYHFPTVPTSNNLTIYGEIWKKNEETGQYTDSVTNSILSVDDHYRLVINNTPIADPWYCQSLTYQLIVEYAPAGSNANNQTYQTLKVVSLGSNAENNYYDFTSSLFNNIPNDYISLKFKIKPMITNGSESATCDAYYLTRQGEANPLSFNLVS